MTLAYLISAHTDAPQLKRLIHALDDKAHFFVHIDKKADIRPFLQLCSASNVHFLSERIDVRWATFRQVEYQLALLRAALAHPVHFHRLIMLSGLDYPIRSNREIRQWIETQGERESLNAYCLDTPLLSPAQRLTYTVPRPFFNHLPTWWATKLSILCRRTMERVGYRCPLHFQMEGQEWKKFKGSSWFCISESLAKYMLNTYDSHPCIRRKFLHTFGPDETMLATIAMNSPEWAPKCKFLEGTYPGLPALTPIHYIIYEPVIQVMTMQHLSQLEASGKLFARKFISGESDELIQSLVHLAQKN